MASHRKTLVGSAVTAVDRAQTGTITIPGGRGGVLTAIELQVFGVITTVVNTGGLVELENDAVDWKPFEFYTQGQTCITSGASKSKPFRIPVHKKLPANSTVTVYYTPQNALSQKLAVTLFWETGMGFNMSRETLSKTGIGTPADCSGGVVDHVTIDIPAEKGGRAKALIFQVWGILTTVKHTGGLAKLKNIDASPSWEPFEILTQTQSALTCGGVELEPLIEPCNLQLPGKSTVQVHFTAQHTANVALSLTVLWNRR